MSGCCVCHCNKEEQIRMPNEAMIHIYVCILDEWAEPWPRAHSFRGPALCGACERAFQVSLWRLHEWINKGNGPRPSHDVVYLILVLTRSAPAHETPASCISPEPNSLSRAEILMGKREKKRAARTLGRALSQLFASNVSIKPRMNRPTNH